MCRAQREAVSLMRPARSISALRSRWLGLTTPMPPASMVMQTAPSRLGRKAGGADSGVRLATPAAPQGLLEKGLHLVLYLY